MTTSLNDYVASGYFLSRWVGPHDCTGIELRRISLAADHSPRKFFPDSWALSWCHGSREERLEEAAIFGLQEPDLTRVTAWADKSFGTAFDAWSVFFQLEDAREAARSMLASAADLVLWGVGLHQSLVSAYCEATKPPPLKPGYAPVGAGGVHIATCVRSAPLAEGGEILGHELLIDDLGCAFNSPESRHLDEQELFLAVGVMPNAHRLIDSFDEALACCRHLDSHAAETPDKITGWRPWLLVGYPLRARR
jgi:hypothetical protein